MRYTIDASVFVSAARPAETDHSLSLEFLEHIGQQDIASTCPTLLLAECAAAIARGTDNEALAQELVRLVVALPAVSLVPLNYDLARRAAEIAGQHRLRGADAVYVAVAEQVGATLISWDQEMLKRGRAVVETASPAELLPQL